MPVLVLGGPTATGKTALALRIACQWGAALVSADAMLVYRGMDIGTAKPSRAALRSFPHAAVDVRDPDQDWTVMDFLEAVEQAKQAHDRVLVVGGTPFYLAALVRPLTRLPAADPALRAALEALPDPHAALQAVDPVSAARLHPNDRLRVVRALEIHALTGRPMSAIFAEDQARRAGEGRALAVAWLDRDPAELKARIALRLERMMATGYLDEVRSLLQAGYTRDLKPMRSLGYRHLTEHLLDGLPLDEALRRTLRDTGTLARKQRTWARGMGWQGTDVAGVLALAERVYGAPRRGPPQSSKASAKTVSS